MSNAKEVIKNWKENKGFPYYPEDRRWRDDEFNKLLSFNRDTLLDTQNKIIGQQKIACDLPIENNQVLLITGCPGSGKTTVINYRAKKARKKLKWYPKYNLNALVDEMISEELKLIINVK